MTENKADHFVLDIELKPWLCPVCGLKRNRGSHAKCSKITQLKYQNERAKNRLKAETTY
jgi:hypothetical protein